MFNNSFCSVTWLGVRNHHPIQSTLIVQSKSPETSKCVSMLLYYHWKSSSSCWQGCRESHDWFHNKQPYYSGFRSDDWGYSRMTIHNQTHLSWEQISDDQVSDSLATHIKGKTLGRNLMLIINTHTTKRTIGGSI